jgi:ATP-dependent DNA helicase HFM1/MER3
MNQISLFLIDEVHLLNEDRGAILEAVVSRMNTMRDFAPESISPLRYIALSATIPNIEDIAEWLQVPQVGIKRYAL